MQSFHGAKFVLEMGIGLLLLEGEGSGSGFSPGLGLREEREGLGCASQSSVNIPPLEQEGVSVWVLFCDVFRVQGLEWTWKHFRDTSRLP